MNLVARGLSRGGGLALLAMMAACGPAAYAPTSPEGTLEAVRRALASGDADALVALSSAEARMVLGDEALRALARDNARELREESKALAAASSRVTARVRFEGDQVPLALSFEPSRGYLLSRGVLGGAGLASPVDAVLALRDALARRSLPGLLRVLGTERRRAILAELAMVIELTADPLDFEIQSDGARAKVQLPGQRQVLLERESDEWRVIDVVEGGPR